MGDANHHYILEYMPDLKGSILEIGSGRGDGSTDFFAGFVYGFNYQLNFYTVDFAKDPYLHAKRLAARIPNMKAFRMTGEDFMRSVFPSTGDKICWAYLDNADWNWYEGDAQEPEWIKEQRHIYQEAGIEYSNAASALAHLQQSKLVHEHAADRCFIHFDDTWLAYGNYTGKGGTAIHWLLNNGWKVIHHGNMSVVLANH